MLGGVGDRRLSARSTERGKNRDNISTFTVLELAVHEDQLGNQSFRHLDGEPRQRPLRGIAGSTCLGYRQWAFSESSRRARHRIGFQIGDTDHAEGDGPLSHSPARCPITVSVRCAAEPPGTAVSARAQGFVAPQACTLGVLCGGLGTRRHSRQVSHDQQLHGRTDYTAWAWSTSNADLFCFWNSFARWRNGSGLTAVSALPCASARQEPLSA